MTEDTVIIPGERSDAHYHRDEGCPSVRLMDDPERVTLAGTDAKPCANCAAGDRDDTEPIEVCPECHQPNFQAVTQSEHNYRCRTADCLVAFDEPDERARKGGRGGNQRGLAGTLMQADPEDVSADNAGEPMTDGGEETVIVSSSAGRRGNTIYHRDEDCGHVQRMAETVEKPLSVIESHYDPCSKCAVEVVTDGGYWLDIDSVGVPSGEGESWADLADRRRRERRPAFDCALCHESHQSRGEALRCCSARFGEVSR